MVLGEERSIVTPTSAEKLEKQMHKDKHKVLMSTRGRTQTLEWKESGKVQVHLPGEDVRVKQWVL